MPEMAGLALGLSTKQLDAIRGADARVTVYDGSIRSGKTIASLLRWLMFTADPPRGGELVVTARTRDTAARNVFAPLMDETLFGPLARLVDYTPGAPTARILDRTVHVLGASDAKAEKTLRGLTVAGAYVDEATVIAEDYFTQLLGRMSVPGAQLFATTNPDSPAHWLKRRFLDRIADGSLPDWRRFQFRLADNPSLSPAYVAAISREYTGLWYRRFILGEWVAAEGAIYPMWDPARHLVAWADVPDMRRLLGVGLDYGTTNATAVLLLGLGVDGRLWLLDEWRHDARVTNVTLTDAQLSAGIRSWLASPHLPYPSALQPEWLAIDPSAASLKAQLFYDQAANVTDAVNDVAYGIRTVASLLGADRLRVTDRCPGFISEVDGYSWDPKATEKGEDVPIKTADHSMDAARYVIATTETLWRGQLREAAERPDADKPATPKEAA